MAKREDWEILKRLSKNNKEISSIYTPLPLIEKHTIVNGTTYKLWE